MKENSSHVADHWDARKTLIVEEFDLAFDQPLEPHAWQICKQVPLSKHGDLSVCTKIHQRILNMHRQHGDPQCNTRYDKATAIQVYSAQLQITGAE